jgi:oxidase EvaA
MTATAILKPRDDTSLPRRFARSAGVVNRGVGISTRDFPVWLAERIAAYPFAVRRIPFAELDGWSFDECTSNLAHRSGRFFSVRGLDVLGGGELGSWQQPIMVQPEAAVIGIIAKEFGGVLHFLMQAKMEPGNPGAVQLSPTVQATPSNYTRVHKGAEVNYIDYFINPERVLVDALQSEHGSQFYQKANRNMIVEVTGDVPVREEFVWLTLGQIGQLMRQNNVVNMDSRSIISCVPFAHAQTSALHSDVEVLSWFTKIRARRHLRSRLIPLAETAQWSRGAWNVSHAEGRYFRIVAVAAEAPNREVPSWSQPLCEPIGLGVNAFVACRFDGVPHLLAHARAEAGFLDTVELGPTVQFTPTAYAHLPDGERNPPFAELARQASCSSLRFDAVLAEEGGRFLNAESRYRIVEIDQADAPVRLPADYRWLTSAQLTSLARHGHYLNVQARSLLAAVISGAADL